jgi:hypothetical protein
MPRQISAIMSEPRASGYPFFAALLLLLLLPAMAGCTFNSEGRSGDVSAFSISKPTDLMGLHKGEVISRLGLPAGSIKDAKGHEYWQYTNSSRYYILMYGKNDRKNLLVRYSGDVVDKVLLVDKGSGTDVLTIGF